MLLCSFPSASVFNGVIFAALCFFLRGVMLSSAAFLELAFCFCRKFEISCISRVVRESTRLLNSDRAAVFRSTSLFRFSSRQPGRGAMFFAASARSSEAIRCMGIRRFFIVVAILFRMVLLAPSSVRRSLQRSKMIAPLSNLADVSKRTFVAWSWRSFFVVGLSAPEFNESAPTRCFSSSNPRRERSAQMAFRR